MAGLTALAVKNARPDRYADGRGLYLLVRETGARSWVLRTKIDGKRKDLGLGSASKVLLAQARTIAADLVAKISRGEDPRPVKASIQVNVPTFAEAARACHEALKSGWSNQRHRDSWLASLERHGGFYLEVQISRIYGRQ